MLCIIIKKGIMEMLISGIELLFEYLGNIFEVIVW